MPVIIPPPIQEQISGEIIFTSCQFQTLIDILHTITTILPNRDFEYELLHHKTFQSLGYMFESFSSQALDINAVNDLIELENKLDNNKHLSDIFTSYIIYNPKYNNNILLVYGANFQLMV